MRDHSKNGASQEAGRMAEELFEVRVVAEVGLLVVVDDPETVVVPPVVVEPAVVVDPDEVLITSAAPSSWKIGAAVLLFRATWVYPITQASLTVVPAPERQGLPATWLPQKHSTVPCDVATFATPI